jgi:hypothetical protein
MLTPEAAELPDAPQGATQLALAGTIVVGDTGTGEAALGWAGRLESELARRDQPVQVFLVGIAQVGEALRGLFSAQAQLVALAPALLAGAADPELLRALVAASAPSGSATRAPLRLLAGPWALALFRGQLNVVVGADTPLLRWPPALRGLRGRFELELSGDGASLVPALADLLRDTGA